MGSASRLAFGAENVFLSDLAGFATLKAAFSSGAAEHLLLGAATAEELAAAIGRSPAGTAMLLGLMRAAGLAQEETGQETLPETGQRHELAPDFAAVLRDRRHLLERKMDFLDLALRDVVDHLPDLLFDLPRFQRRSRTFALFRYDRAGDLDPAAIENTRRWVDYVTALTEAEAPTLLAEIDLSGARRLLEVGGNSGAFAEALLARNPALSAAVLDLPAVCALGEERMRHRPERSRLRFTPGDAREVPWPGPADVVLFKSVLHDWPAAEMRLLLEKAARCLAPGGRVVICERAPLALGCEPLPLWQMANLVFAPFYRVSEEYVSVLEDLGVNCGTVRRVSLDVPFQIIVGRKEERGD